MVLDEAQHRDDADARRDEQQRQVLQQPVAGGDDGRVLGRPTPREQAEQQEHPEHRPGDRQVERAGDERAHELAEEEEQEARDHWVAFAVAAVTTTAAASLHGAPLSGNRSRIRPMTPASPWGLGALSRGPLVTSDTDRKNLLKRAPDESRLSICI